MELKDYIIKLCKYLDDNNYDSCSEYTLLDDYTIRAIPRNYRHTVLELLPSLLKELGFKFESKLRDTRTEKNIIYTTDKKFIICHDIKIKSIKNENTLEYLKGDLHGI